MNHDDLYKIIRGFGYTTSSQSEEIANAILAATHPALAGDVGLPVQASVSSDPVFVALTERLLGGEVCPARIELAAYIDAQRAHAAPQVAQVVAGGLADAAIAWWEGKRPLIWTEAQHIETPEVNCAGASEINLARAVAAILATKETT